MIPAGQNSSGGALLNSFCVKSRVIKKGEFHVWIVDSGSTFYHARYERSRG